MLAIKGNKEVKILDMQKKEYLESGYTILDDKLKVIASPNKEKETKVNELEKKVKDLTKANEELITENEKLEVKTEGLEAKIAELEKKAEK